MKSNSVPVGVSMHAVYVVGNSLILYQLLLSFHYSCVEGGEGCVTDGEEEEAFSFWQLSGKEEAGAVCGKE